VEASRDRTLVTHRGRDPVVAEAFGRHRYRGSIRRPLCRCYCMARAQVTGHLTIHSSGRPSVCGFQATAAARPPLNSGVRWSDFRGWFFARIEFASCGFLAGTSKLRRTSLPAIVFRTLATAPTIVQAIAATANQLRAPWHPALTLARLPPNYLIKRERHRAAVSSPYFRC